MDKRGENVTVSVIIPAYNCSDYLANMVASIRKSGLNVLEILIVNDGSTDGTEKIALQLQEQSDDVRVISQPNSGVSAARNKGIREAVGDYLFFVDADDSLAAGSLSDVNGILDAQRPDMLLFGMVFDHYKNGAVYRRDAFRYPKRGTMLSPAWAQAFGDLYAYNMLSPVWNKLIRRDLILAHQVFFREDMIEMEDYLFSVQCLLSCEQIYLLDSVAYHYRQPEDERSTFDRLWRIPSLSEYMGPFYETAEQLEERFSKTGASCRAVSVSDRIYSMLFREKLRFASREQIRLAAQDMLSGRHADVIARRDPKLYQSLKDRRYTYVWIKRAIRRVRHRLAVQVKYRRSLRKRT
ncbi:MAG: glycosyltransferase family 2 protein [Firmicutes bacterium]|nr:glycosyltransferase family 2 protein [Bacillota bacterium]